MNLHQQGQAILHLYRDIDRLLSQGRLDEVNSLLKDAEVESLPLIYLVALLRITYPAKKHLGHWEATYWRIRQHISSRGEDPSVLLVGLQTKERSDEERHA